MRVLQLCLRVPFPPTDGGTIAMYGMATGMKKAGAQIDVMALNTRKHHVDMNEIPESYRSDFDLTAIDVNTTVRPLPAFMNLFGSSSYNIDRFDVPEFHDLLIGRLAEKSYDVIHLESLFMAPYISTIRKYTDAVICLRNHNVEHRIWEHMFKNQVNILKRWYMRLLAKRLKIFELNTFNQIDGMLCISDDDSDNFRELGYKGPMEVVSIGLNPDRYTINRSPTDRISFFHLASMDWLPNVEAVEWYIKTIHPTISESQEDIQVHFAGRSMPDRLKRLANDTLKIHDKIDDAGAFMDDKQVMIVPLLSGSGVRVKIIEGLAMGKTIISTSIGAEGIKYTDGENILIADTKDAFAAAMLKCSHDPAFSRQVGMNGRKLFEDEYSDLTLGKRTVEFYRMLTKK